MNPLTEKVALITGAARRIGAVIAETLHAAGMNIVLHYHASETEALALCEQCNQKRADSAVVVRAELQNSESAAALVKQAATAWGRLDVLVNNASRFYRTHLGDVTEYAWDDLINTNLKVPFFLAQAAAPFLISHQGNIINITDSHFDKPLKDYAVYSISKAGLVSMTKVLAKELGPAVRVNAVAPGAVMWPEGVNELSEEDKNKIIHRIPLQRSGGPQDIAKAVLFFVRDAEYATGQILNIDGGRSLFG